MSSAQKLPAKHDRLKPIAPRWHTAIFALIFVSLGVAGFLLHSKIEAGPHPKAGHHSSSFLVYFELIAAEYGLFSFVKGGLNRYQTSLREIVGQPWHNASGFLRDAGLGIGLWLFWVGIERLLKVHASAHSNAAIPTPRHPLGILLWITVSICAGVVEEFAFRGYLQRQIAALSGNPLLAIVLQAALFGIGHLYEGVAAASRIALFGLLFGVMAQWRRSLLPGMIAHTAADIAAGLFGI